MPEGKELFAHYFLLISIYPTLPAFIDNYNRALFINTILLSSKGKKKIGRAENFCILLLRLSFLLVFADARRIYRWVHHNFTEDLHYHLILFSGFVQWKIQLEGRVECSAALLADSSQVACQFDNPFL